MSNYFNRIKGGFLKAILTKMGRSRISAHTGDLRIAGLSAPVDIRRDAQGVPYLYAENRQDLFFAQGFVHAQDRLWQMEVNRRLATGRLSELFGAAALDTDRLCRTFGFARMAQEDYNLIDEDMHKLVQSYCDGINACIKHMGKKLPLEYKLVKHQPEPWTALQVMAFTRLMTMQLSHGWGHELARAKLYEALGPELAAELDIRHAVGNPPTLPKGIELNQLDTSGKMQAKSGPFFKEVNGSNAWALSGDLTDTGKPYLCSDPHLAAMMPSVWYQIYLESPDFRVQGVSIPGMPMVMIGHNSHISWGVTLAFSDIQDLFVERLRQKDAGGEKQWEYEYKGEWIAAEVKHETIQIKDGETHVEEVVITPNGPLISDVVECYGQQLCLNSSALRSSTLTMGWYGLDLAQGWDDFVAAVHHIEAPGLNIVYADVEGNIGYYMTGKTPIRKKGHGQMPVPAWDGEYDWAGFVPFEEMPHCLNPERGYVISANNKVVEPDFPHFMGDAWMNGYRARRIEELLLEKPRWSRDEFPAIHQDVFCRPGVEFAAHYADLKRPVDAQVAEAMDLLCNWDGYLTVDTVGGAIYQVCRRELLQLLYRTAAKSAEHEELLYGTGANPVMFRVSEYQGKDTVAILELLENPDSGLLRLVGGKEKALLEAMSKAVAYLQKTYGKQSHKWKWGQLHQIEWPHSMAVKKPLDLVFNAGPWPMHGDTDTVCQTSMHPGSPYGANLASPSYRQIVDMSDFNRSLWIKPPGQSGQLGSKNYQDQVAGWMEGTYFPMVWDRKEVEAIATRLLCLNPA